MRMCSVLQYSNKMLLMAALFFFLLVATFLTPQVAAQSCNRITAADLGNTTTPSSEGLISSILTLQSSQQGAPSQIQLLQYNLVCETTTGSRNQFRHVSVVAEYRINSSVIQSQFEFSCQIVSGQDVWSSVVGGSTGETVTTPPAATLNTTLRRDCYVCLSPARPGSTANNAEHCLECASSCHSLLMCTSQFPFGCCNFMTPEGNCVTSCPSTSSSNDDFNCECLPGYTGGDCGTNIDECSPNPCLNNGNCTDGINEFSCECELGYTGVTCSVMIHQHTTVPFSPVLEECRSSSDCENGGTCVQNASGISFCQCSSNFQGNLCQDAATPCGDNCVIAIVVVVVGLILFAVATITIVVFAKFGRNTGKRRITKNRIKPELETSSHDPPSPIPTPLSQEK